MLIPKLRVVRPTNDLAALMHFYCEGLGLERLAGFAAHQGFDGVMLGHPGAPYHLEFTREDGQAVAPAPTAEHLLVFYFPDAAAWRAAGARLEAAGYAAVPAHNPYWDAQGRTFQDPDGYRVVLQHAAWDL
ncbi:MAG: VOC family protein [Janthinobacterium lividum]